MILSIMMMQWAMMMSVIVYMLALLFIFLYSLVQAQLLYHYLKADKKNKIPLPERAPVLPPVTVQLPVYNEKYVVERLIDAVAQLDYPKDKLEIQVLDDSTDETTSIIATKVVEWKLKGVDIAHIHRQNRHGFKAGALAESLPAAKGELIAIFDADFIPAMDFLSKTTPYFTDRQIGMVQTRWEHLNRNYSLLTSLQAFGLDAHFTVEQVGRNSGGCFMNFNGTGGIWRKTCILDAGNWQPDTLTEDLDLSYRAQLKGWKFKYLEDIISPAELPPVMSALKSQQYRWTKGGAETARKHLIHVLRSGLSVKVKWHALFHLLNSGVFISIIILAVLSIPMLFFKARFPVLESLYASTAVFFLSLGIIGTSYWVAFRKVAGSNGFKIFLRFLMTFFLFLCVSMGLSLHNAVAVVEGYLGRTTPFVRTPKFNILTGKDKWRQNQYHYSGINLLTVYEGILTLYFVFGVIASFLLKDHSFSLFHCMLAAGFGIVFYYSLLHSKIFN